MSTKKKPKTKSNRPFYRRQWGANEARYRTRLLHHFEKLAVLKPSFWWHQLRIWQKILAILIAIIMFFTGVMYGIARWYIYTHQNQPIQLGATFIPEYARYYGLDPQDTLHALIYDAGLRHIRLVSYWNDIEPTKGNFNFDELDWQFKMAEASKTKVSLALGLRQPRWPECHMPDWAAQTPKDQWSQDLKVAMGKVIERYKDSPALESYQLENEYFLKVFGICPDFTRERLVDEYNFVKQADPNHPVVVSRSNNAIGIPIYAPKPDISGVSVYKRVWDKTLTRRYYEFPFPAWFYAFLAGAGKIVNGNDMIIHELQAEPWLPEGYNMLTAPVSEQDKSLSPERLKDRIDFAEATGLKTIDLWGAEWWYWRKTTGHDDRLWNVVKDAVKKNQNANTYREL
jgi:hypothetical protein